MTLKKSLIATGILVTTLLAACGGSDAGSDANAVSAASASPDALTTGVEPKSNGSHGDTAGRSPADRAGGDKRGDDKRRDDKRGDDRAFNRIASFPVCSQIGSSCDSSETTAAEIVAVSVDGKTLVYTNSPRGEIGFVDIGDPARPVAIGALDMDGEPTSVTVRGRHALVAVNTSEDRTNPSGRLTIVDIELQAIVASLALPGQPDSIAVSGNGRYVVVVIENERDEELGDGRPPQLPGGGLVVVDAAGKPGDWKMRSVDLADLPGALFAEDPEPEYVSINDRNVAVVTLQENNHIVLVSLADGKIIDHYSAGTVNLERVDATDDRPAAISFSESLAGIPREPDGVAWISSRLFATADEGDLDGGSRGFTVYHTNGTVAFASGNLLEHEAARLGHYPDRRSDAKGNEPENVAFARFQGDDYLFVASERSSLVFVFDMADPVRPRLKQTLPAGVGPEGILPIPSRKLLVAASEEDARDLIIRSVINIYSYGRQAASYPTILSVDRSDGTPVPWGALSGLAAQPGNDQRVFAIDDSFYRANRIFGIDVSRSPALLDTETRISDADGVLAALQVPDAATVDRAAVFDSLDLAAMINDDKSVNLDPEGIAVAADGGFWIASEGAGTVGEPDERPINSHNLVLKLNAAGVIERVIALPESINAIQQRFGFEGIAEADGELVVAFQRAWGAEANPRLGIYNLASNTWRFVFYPLDAVESPNGGWVGLSDISALGSGRFLVVERDNQGGPDARIKRLYGFDLTGAADGATVTKTLVRDLLPDLVAPGGATPEKIEGLAVLGSGEVLIVNDNDGVNDNSGETQLLRLRRLDQSQ